MAYDPIKGYETPGGSKLAQFSGISSQGLLGGQSPAQGPMIPGLGASAASKFTDNSDIIMPGWATVKTHFGDDVQSPGSRSRNQRNTMKGGVAKSLPLSWMQNDPETLKKFVNTGILNKVPGFDVGMGMPEIMKAWENLLEQSFEMNKYMPGGADRKLTPWDVLNSYSNQAGKFGTIKRGDWLYDIATGEKVKYVGPKTKTQTNKRIDLSSAEDVRAITTNALSELLGRAPTAEELGRFRATINALEESNPITATTTQTLDDMGEVIDTQTRQEGGISAEARAAAITDDTKATPEFAKFQSGTTYWGALVQMLGGG